MPIQLFTLMRVQTLKHELEQKFKKFTRESIYGNVKKSSSSNTKTAKILKTKIVQNKTKTACSGPKPLFIQDRSFTLSLVYR